MSEFVNYLHEVFEHFGIIRSRKMFGGYGIYHNDLMFGLAADDQLYLKTDKETVSIFENHDLPPFEYNKDGKMMKMSYYLAPEVIYDDAEQAAYWANLAFETALRVKAAKKPKNKKKE